MKIDEVPHDASFYQGHKRLCYAVDENGKYLKALSSGWDAETTVTGRALENLERQVQAAHALVAQGRRTPLYPVMIECQMTPSLLAGSSRLPRVAVWLALFPFTARVLPSFCWRRLARAMAVPVEVIKA